MEKEIHMPSDHDYVKTHRTLLWPVGIIEVEATVCVLCGQVKKEIYRIIRRDLKMDANPQS